MIEGTFANNILNDLFSNLSPQVISGIICIILTLTFGLELRKFIIYHSYPDVMELSGIGAVATGLFTVTGDLLLAGLAGILALMIIGSFEVRENPIWFRMMITFTISYGFFFLMVLIGFISSKVFPALGSFITSILSGFLGPDIDIQQFFVGLGYNLIIWIMVFTAFIVFGRKFIIVTRFISPQMTYLVLYFVALFIILQLNLPKIDLNLPFGSFELDLWKYIAIFLANIFLYLISGYLLTLLFGIKPLQDKRVEKIIEEVQVKINTPIRRVGIVKAPILNAFAFGPWFDQRIAYIASDLGVFTDSEIRGITAHELAHVQRKHTLLLLGLTAVELIFKALIDFPSSPWEYVLQINSETWDFLTFWIFNIILFAFLLTFVKMLEGQADKITREKGFGIDLAESLYRLEGFYYGIAGEIGFNTQLMTGKERTKDENIRFMGDQAFYLYRNLAPSRMTCLMNLIASHPLTSIRIALQIDPKISAFKAGIMIWMLMIPGLRKRTIINLQKNATKMADILSDKFSRDFGDINIYSEIVFEEAEFKSYLNRFIIAKPWRVDGSTYWGKVVDLRRNQNIISPFELKVEIETGNYVYVSKGDYNIVLADPNEKYFDKSGKIFTLKSVEIKKNKFHRFQFDHNGKTLLKKSIGLRIKDLEMKDYWFVYKNGFIHPWTFEEFQVGKDFHSSVFSFSDSNGERIQYTGRDLVISLPPLFQLIKSKNWKKEKDFFERLKALKEPFILYDKEDIDIGAPCKVIEISDMNIKFLEGKMEKERLSNQIDAIILDYPFHMINIRREMGLGNILSLKIFDRGIKSNYIGL